MVPLIVVLTIIVFVIVDFSLRVFFHKQREARIRKEREEALDVGLKLDFSEEAKTLKRVEVSEPKARVLAVDDESIILDSFRKIIVAEGYSIDTVEKGQEMAHALQCHLDCDTDCRPDDFVCSLHSRVGVGHQSLATIPMGFLDWV